MLVRDHLTHYHDDSWNIHNTQQQYIRSYQGFHAILFYNKYRTTSIITTNIRLW